MQKSGIGHESNFFGFEKSDSPINRARARVSWCADSFVKNLASAISLYSDIHEQHKELSKCTKSLYEASGLQKYAETPLIARVGEDGLEIVEKLSKLPCLDKRAVDKIWGAYFDFLDKLTFDKKDKNIELINEIGVKKLTNLLEIK